MKSKKHIFLLFVLLIISTQGHALINCHIDSNSRTITDRTSNAININESMEEEFSQDALTFIQNHFDFKEIIKKVYHDKFHAYEIVFKCKKGYIETVVSKEGKLVSSKQHFQNIFLPSHIRKDIYENYEGYSVIDVDYKSYSRKANIYKKIYKVKLAKGKESKILKFKV